MHSFMFFILIALICIFLLKSGIVEMLGTIILAILSFIFGLIGTIVILATLCLFGIILLPFIILGVIVVCVVEIVDRRKRK